MATYILYTFNIKLLIIQFKYLENIGRFFNSILNKNKNGGINVNSFKESESVILFCIETTGTPVKEILSKKLNISSRLVRKLQESNGILLNGNKVSMDKITTKGDTLIIEMDDENQEIKPQDIPLDIIYEDYDLIVVNKQPYILVHPTKNHKDNTIANGLANYFKEKNINKKIRFVNRLDMNTSGILVIAKNPFGHQQMAQQFENNTVDKRYIAVVNGRLDKEYGVIDKPIGRSNEDSIKNLVTKKGRRAITKYWVIERYNNATMLEVKIETGRTHQIRVHLNHIGHPIIGDTLYYKTSELIDRQALHSYSLEFNIPRDGRKIKIYADLPEDMRRLIQSLKTIK